MAPTPLSEAQIRQHASEESFKRGLAYYERDAVGPLVLRGSVLQAEVEGSEYEPYLVSITLDSAGVKSTLCTCPYEWGGWCKHIVATLLAYANTAPQRVDVRPALADMLAPLDRDQLEGLLLRLAEDHMDLAEQIDRLLTAPITIPATTGKIERRTPVDTEQLQQHIRQIFRANPIGEYHESSDILDSFDPLVANIRAFLDADDAQSALPLLDTLTEEYSRSVFDYDDSDGELGDFFDELGSLWAEALLGSNLNKAKRKDWRKKLDAWNATANKYGFDSLAIAIQAANEGWSDPWVDAAIIDEAREGARPTTTYGDELIQIRLRILVRSNHMREALNLAKAAGLRLEHALLLLSAGRTAEALEVGQQLTSEKQVLTLAKALREGGELGHALTIGEHGLNLPEAKSAGTLAPSGRAALAAWLVDLAAGLGRLDIAQRAGAEALRLRPDVALYQRMAELAGAEWPKLRAKLLDGQRKAKNVPNSGRIAIFLREGLIDDAIKVLRRYDDDSDWARVMDAASALRPDWVIEAAGERADVIMREGESQSYDVAVGWLRRVRTAYQGAGREKEWGVFIQGVRAKYGRKYKLMGLIDAMEKQRR